LDIPPAAIAAVWMILFSLGPNLPPRIGNACGTAVEMNLITAKPAMAYTTELAIAHMSTLGTPYAEKVGSEGPSGLQTKVNVTRVHKRAAKDADND